MAIASYEPIIFGDSVFGRGIPRFVGQDISIHMPDPGDTLTLVGDARTLLGGAVGGPDTLFCFAYAGSLIIGDAFTIAGRAQGGNDSVLATSNVSAIALGDALTLGGRASGGDDIVDARGDKAVAYGDSYDMRGRSHGGDDVVSGASFPLITTELFGDAQILSDAAIGGNDILVAVVAGSAGGTVMYGDGAQLLEESTGGNDTLISAAQGNEVMWGDAAFVGPEAHTGNDIFVFEPGNGQDTIMDFQPGQDKLELKGFGFTVFSDLSNTISYTEQGALIGFDAANHVLVLGVNELHSSDFIFS